MHLDELHIAILNELQENYKLSNAEIGRRVGLTAPAVSERIKNLEKWQIIKGYKAVIDFRYLGYPEKVMIGVNVASSYKRMFLRNIEDFEGLTDVFRTTGNYCYFLYFNLRGAPELDRILNKLESFGQTVTFSILSQPVENKKIKLKM